MAGTAVEEIKARLDLGEVIGQQVALRRSGRSLKGLCPFHAEKTPSFYVFPETGTWKCFGCGEGGDLFTFVQKRESLEFGEALRMLAAKAGVELPTRDRRTPEAQAAEERLRAILASTELYFRAALDGRSGAAARAYLDGRGVDRASVERFGLGYAPASGLIRHLQDNGFDLDEAAEVGVVGRRDDGSRFEMFRERVMFPIRDASGHTIGFGGRVLGDGQPKYLNGPQTRFFDKSGCLFALDLARAAIRQTSKAVIVEGYLDAIMAHQHGFENVVATLGTALTERHLELLGRRATEIILALDADAAGQAATLRALDVARNAPADAVVPVPNPGVRGYVRYQAIRRTQIKVLTLPSGSDPDELIRRDPAEWSSLVGGASPVVDFLLNRLGERHDLASASGKRDAVQEAVSVIRDLTDPIEREHYVQRLAALVGIDESGLRQVLNAVRARPAPPTASPAPKGGPERPEAYALALFYLDGGAAEGPRVEDITSPEGQAVYRLLAVQPATSRDEAAFATLLEAADPALRSSLEEVAAWLPRLLPLSAEQRRRELEVASLKLRQQHLRVQHQEVLALLGEQSAEGRPAPASLLAAIAAQLRETEAALASRNGIGSLVWRSRQVGEVLGG